MKYLLSLLFLFSTFVHAKTPDGTIYVSKSRATVCAPGFCVPTLVGTYTLEGNYPVTHARTNAPGYGRTMFGGADVLAFGTRIDGVPLAIHRVWKMRPDQRRIERLQGPLAGRIGVTGGCINVMDDIYDKLVDCCSKGTVVIIP